MSTVHQPENYAAGTDERLVERIVAEGDRKLFNLLYQRYFRKVKERSRNLLHDDALADDVAQDIFSKVFEKLNTFRFSASFSTWLYAITYHYCIEYLRRRKNMHYPEWNSRQEIPDIVDDDAEDLTTIRYDNLQKVMEMIHPEEKALLLMKYEDDLPLKMIREVLNISESAVKMRLKRAKARVVHLYQQHYLSKE